jgi:hypothetical protein
LLSSHAQQAGISTSGKPCNFNVIEGIWSNLSETRSLLCQLDGLQYQLMKAGGQFRDDLDSIIAKGFLVFLCRSKPDRSRDPDLCRTVNHRAGREGSSFLTSLTISPLSR